MKAILWFVVGVVVGAVGVWKVQALKANDPLIGEKRKEYAVNTLEYAEFETIGAQYPTPASMGIRKESVEIISAGTISLRSIALDEVRPVEDPELQELLRNTLLSVHSYDPPCLCAGKVAAEFIFQSNGEQVILSAQYEGHQKCTITGNPLHIGLSTAGTNVLLKIHNKVFPEEEVWRYVELPPELQASRSK